MSTLPSQPNDTPVDRETPAPQLALGQWYWVMDSHRVRIGDSSEFRDEAYEWLGCVMNIGSNYAEIHSPHDPGGGYASLRVHFDEFWTRLRFETDADQVIRDRIAHYRSESNRLLAEVRDVSARLGLKTGGALPAPSNEGTSLVVLSGQPDISAYRQALVVAKETTLPQLFEDIKTNNKSLARWMTASTLPMLAQTNQMKDAIGEVTERIFSVSLYAGLTEQVVQCCDGAPAPFEAKLHVMQRRCYMDEECLANYDAGGMEFKDIRQFDAWISRPENRDRILPFPRTVVAMRVRRHVKDRGWDGSFLGAFVNMNLANSDKYTKTFV